MPAPRASSNVFAIALGLPLLVSSGMPALRAQPEFLGDRGMAYAAFDRLPQTDIDVHGSVLHVGFASGTLALPKPAILAWIGHSANVVAAYYGRFPVASARILVVPVAGRGVRGGTTWGYGGAAIRLLVGADANERDLRGDWKIVHEMVHLALPDLDESHNWLSEGLATYIEPIARVQAGDLSAQSIWSDMLRDMPKGLPLPGDRGLDRTHTWARTYWGGALFCLLADVRLREQTGNRFGLQDAMRGVLMAGGNHEVHWPIARVLAAADHATGTQVLATLYAQMADAPVSPDLAALWGRLGVVAEPGGGVRLDDTRTLSTLREAITREPARQPTR